MVLVVAERLGVTNEAVHSFSLPVENVEDFAEVSIVGLASFTFRGAFE